MASVTKNCQTGTGSATFTYGGQGDGTITVTSSPNDLYVSRSMTIDVSTTLGASITRQVTVTQAMKEPNFVTSEGYWFVTSDNKYFTV